MNILIINPPHSTAIIREGRCQSPQNMRKTYIPQMTLAYLAGLLGSKGHTIKAHDCIASEMTPEDVFDIIEDFNPGLVLVNTTTPSINSDIAFIKKTKENYFKRRSNCASGIG